jgi:hypothetical protein
MGNDVALTKQSLQLGFKRSQLTEFFLNVHDTGFFCHGAGGGLDAFQVESEFADGNDVVWLEQFCLLDLLKIHESSVGAFEIANPKMITARSNLAMTSGNQLIGQLKVAVIIAADNKKNRLDGDYPFPARVSHSS